MEQVQIVFLLFAIVLIAAFFYLRRARNRDAGDVSTPEDPRQEPPAEE